MDQNNIFLDQQNFHLQILFESLQKNDEEVKKWTKFQKQYETVLEGLNMLPLELSVNCMIPIGKQALIKGKLKHTNEILVCLGEGYFVNYTAAQAIELTRRRINRTQEILDFFEKERYLLESRQNCLLRYGAFQDNVGQELVEHWNDQDLENWRIKHRQKEKEYHESKSKEEQVGKKFLTTEEELFRRLDELELEEELADEYYRSQDENPDNVDDYDDDDDDEDEDDEDDDDDYDDDDDDDEEDDDEKFISLPIKILKEDSLPSYKQLEKVEESSLNNPNLINKDNSNQLLKSKKVSFENTSNASISATEEDNIESTKTGTDNVLKINFNHSNVFPQLSESDNKGINNPGDINYTLFQPKSILKRSQDDLNVKESSFVESTSDKYLESVTTNASAFEDIVSQTVHEKKQESVQFEMSEPVSNKKPMSRFKLERSSNK